MYNEGDTITDGKYEGFVITKVSLGWYRVYHPSNVKNGDIEAATTSIRWSWV